MIPAGGLWRTRFLPDIDQNEVIAAVKSGLDVVRWISRTRFFAFEICRKRAECWCAMGIRPRGMCKSSLTKIADHLLSETRGRCGGLFVGVRGRGGGKQEPLQVSF